MSPFCTKRPPTPYNVIWILFWPSLMAEEGSHGYLDFSIGFEELGIWQRWLECGAIDKQCACNLVANSID